MKIYRIIKYDNLFYNHLGNSTVLGTKSTSSEGILRRSSIVLIYSKVPNWHGEFFCIYLYIL